VSTIPALHVPEEAKTTAKNPAEEEKEEEIIPEQKEEVKEEEEDELKSRLPFPIPSSPEQKESVTPSTSAFCLRRSSVSKPVFDNTSPSFINNEDEFVPGGSALLHSEYHRTYLFEISHEVANKSGGIYTVVSTKAATTVKEWGNRYALIGQYNPKNAAVEFEALEPTKLAREIVDTMLRNHGVTVHFGRWLVPGYPRCFLIDVGSSWNRLGEWRWDLQPGFCVEEDNITNNAIVWGYQVALLFMELQLLLPGRQLIAHFHEWLSSVSLIVMKRWHVKVATVFTTHATLLGRYICAGGMDLYDHLRNGNINPEQEAAARQIYNRHWIEVGAARGADVFTTVSDITDYEAKMLLGREADIVTPNGLNIDRFLAVHEFQTLHVQVKRKIHEFVRGHFFGSYDFDLSKTVYFFTAGRREYHNKGVDLMIEALAELNYILKRERSDVTVVAFIIMPGEVNNYNVESIRGQSIVREVKGAVNEVAKEKGEKLYESVLRGRVPELSELYSQENLINIKRRVQMVNQGRNPPIVTHNVSNDDKDEILCHLRSCKLFNMKEDRVKVIYHPEFLNANSPLLPLSYDDFVRGCHLGIFPSYYEPWGYTPAECCVSGIPSVTSNLSGFAGYMEKYLARTEEHGIYIIDRKNRSFGECKSQLASALWRFTQQTMRQRIEVDCCPSPPSPSLLVLTCSPFLSFSFAFFVHLSV
jgi:glycogen(starch) synthase